MAGGMSTGRGESLAQRVANTQARAPANPGIDEASPSSVSAGPDVPPVVRHCWYDGGTYGRQAALLLEWRRVGDGFDGRIAVAVPDAAGWALVEMWVDSGLLSPP